MTRLMVVVAEETRPARTELDFDEVYETHVDYVWRVLATFGVPEARLEDATQDVFVIVHDKLSTFEGRSKLTTWLYAIARNVALDIVRRVARERGRSEALLGAREPEATAPSPEERVGDAEARRILRQLLDALEPGRREVFVLVEIEQVPVREVARRLRLNENTVWSRLRLARGQFERHAARLRAREGGSR